MILKLIFLGIILWKTSVHSFNISPLPNIVLQQPNLKTFQNKTESSYFGYSMNLRESTIIIGAPRHESISYEQRLIKEPGAIFRCFLNNESCNAFIFDESKNGFRESTVANNSYEIKDYQMLGATMDGDDKDDGVIIVCAPNYVGSTYVEMEVINGNIHGMCFTASDYAFNQPQTPNRVHTMGSRRQWFHYGPDYYPLYSAGQQGFSAHYNKDTEFYLTGAPGIRYWTGSVVAWHRSVNYQIDHDIPDSGQFFELDSYVGWAVSSGSFNKAETPLWVASAPRANSTFGLVAIFSNISKGSNESTANFELNMIPYAILEGNQMGAFFGYDILTEDFNADGWPDLAVSAPMYSKDGYNDSGAVHVYMNNMGNLKKAQILTSTYLKSGRFGTALGKVGDVNKDGFNDIAIGAPFEDNGVVYIYLGGPFGISSTPSQKIVAPDSSPNSMFGHALSKGVDIDKNGYKDFAVGAPNSEKVYVFKSYPVIRILTEMSATKEKIKLESTIPIKMCLHFETDSRKIFNYDINLNIQLSVDVEFMRASFSKTSLKNSQNQTITIRSFTKCFDYKIEVKSSSANIFKPIKFQYKYELADKISDLNSTYCDKCVAVNPNDVSTYELNFTLETGCADKICKPDLQLSANFINLTSEFILGTAKFIGIRYEIKNVGEPSYETMLTITLPSNTTEVSKIPVECEKNATFGEINCQVEFENGNQTYLDVFVDAASLDFIMDNTFVVNASILSSSSFIKEINPGDNSFEMKLELVAISEIEAFGWSSESEIGMKDPSVISYYEIINKGPSILRELSGSVFVPYSIKVGNVEVVLIDPNNETITGSYKNDSIDFTWYKDNILIFKNGSSIGVEEQEVENFTVFQNFDFPRMRRQIEPSTKIDLQSNATVFLNCSNPNVTCLEFKFTAKNFKAEHDQSIIINIGVSFDLDKIDLIFEADKKVAFYKISSSFKPERNKAFDDPSFSILRKPAVEKTALWIYIVSGVSGILLLIAMTFGMHKCGFFKRDKMVQLQILKRQSVINVDASD